MWDCTNNRAMIYIDPCIKRVNVLAKIKSAFDLKNHVLAKDNHYRCQRRADSPFVDGIRNTTVIVRKADCENTACFLCSEIGTFVAVKYNYMGERRRTKENRSVIGYV